MQLLRRQCGWERALGLAVNLVSFKCSTLCFYLQWCCHGIKIIQLYHSVQYLRIYTASVTRHSVSLANSIETFISWYNLYIHTYTTRPPIQSPPLNKYSVTSHTLRWQLSSTLTVTLKENGEISSASIVQRCVTMTQPKSMFLPLTFSSILAFASVCSLSS